MHHLSSSNTHDIKISIKKLRKDLAINKVEYRKEYDGKHDSFDMERSLISASNLQSCIILAIITGRGKFKHEVGLAVIDLYYPHLTLCQISDCLVYANTLAKINIYQPDEIIMPENNINTNNCETNLRNMIIRRFNNIHITIVSTLHFSALVGWDLIQIYSTTKSSSVKQIIKHKYYALSAASAVLKYIAFIQHMTYAPQTVKVEYHSSNDSINLDIETVELLEIVRSLNEASPNFTLYNALNKCVTNLGKQLLRTSLLQPLYNITCINKRIQCISELVLNNSLLDILQDSLKKMRGAEKLLNVAYNINKCDNIHQAEKNLNYILLLKKILDIIPEFQIVINNLSPSMNQLKHNFENENYLKMNELIFQLVQVDATFVQGYTSSNMQRCFAIKPKISELLDIIRQAYCELIDQMIQYVDHLSEKYCFQFILTCNSSNGYYIQVNLPQNFNYNLSNLTKYFVILKHNRNKLSLTTEKLIVDSQKCKEICEEIHIMSNILMENLIEKIRVFTDYFFDLCKYTGELDFIMSLAIISKIPGFVQPIFGSKLCFIDSYHPVQFLMGFKTAVSNNIIASVPYNFQIITGPNLSGKTTYLKQIILLHILAQIGCFIPARIAELRLCDRFFYHSSNYYNIDNDISLYEYEIKRLSYIISYLSDYSLITLDEPCSKIGTQNGTCLAVSICIKILSTNAFCFCTTHQYYLTRIAETFLNATNLYFDCYSRFTNRFTLMYTHQLKIGITTINHYGLSIAELSNLSESLLIKARIIANKLFVAQKENCIFRKNNKLELLEKYYSLIAKLYNFIKTKKFTSTSVLSLLKKFYSSLYNNILQENHNFIRKIKKDLFIFKEIFENNDSLKYKNKSVLLQLLMTSSNVYVNNTFYSKQYIDNFNIIDSNNLTNLNYCIKLTDRDKLTSTYKVSNSFKKFKLFLSNNQYIENYRRKNISHISHLKFMKEKYFSSTILDKSENQSEFNKICCEDKIFSVNLFYKNLLNMNLSLCDYKIL